MQPATTIPLHDAVDIRTSAKAKNGPCRCIVMRVSCVSRIDRSMCQCNVRCPAAHLLLQALWKHRGKKKRLNVTSDSESVADAAAVTVTVTIMTRASVVTRRTRVERSLVEVLG